MLKSLKSWIKLEIYGTIKDLMHNKSVPKSQSINNIGSGDIIYNDSKISLANILSYIIISGLIFVCVIIVGYFKKSTYMSKSINIGDVTGTNINLRNNCRTCDGKKNDDI